MKPIDDLLRTIKASACGAEDRDRQDPFDLGSHQGILLACQDCWRCDEPCVASLLQIDLL